MDFLQGKLPIRFIYVDGVEQTGIKDLDFDGSTFTVSADGEVLSISSVAEVSDPVIVAEVQGVADGPLILDGPTGLNLQVNGTSVARATAEGWVFGAADPEADQDGAIDVLGITAPSGSPAAGRGRLWWSTADFGFKTRDSAGLVCTLARINSAGALLGCVSVTSAEGLTLASDGVEPVVIDGGAGGVVLDADTVSMTTAGEAVMTLSGTAGRVHSGAGDLGLSCTTGDGVDCRVNSVSCLRVTATALELGAAVAAMTPVVAFSIAPTVSVGATGKALSAKAGAAPAGFVGGALTLGGGAGGTAGTNLWGGVDIDNGTTVGGGGPANRWMMDSAQGVVLQKVGSSWYLRAGTGAPNSGSAGSAPLLLEGSSAGLAALSSFLVLSASTDIYLRTGASSSLIRQLAGTTFSQERQETVAIASATTTTVISFTTTSNRVYHVTAFLVVSNDTDNEGATYELSAAFKNVGGTVTQIGATVIAQSFEDAGQAGLVPVLDLSGTAIRVRLTTDAADAVNVNATARFHERALV